jgi:hypothetical protein
MSQVYEFYGPLHVYLRREGGEYQAWVDPFSIIGTGRSEQVALRHARDLLISHLRALAGELRRHGPHKVRLLSPMDAEEKSGALKVYVGGVHVRVAGEPTRRRPVRPDPIEKIGRVLPRARDYSLDLLPAKVSED